MPGRGTRTASIPPRKTSHACLISGVVGSVATRDRSGTPARTGRGPGTEFASFSRATMTYLTRERFLELAESHMGPCVSLYVSFADLGRGEAERRRSRLEGLLPAVMREARRFPDSPGIDAVNTLLEPVHALLDWDRYWRYQSVGLAVFSSSVLFRAFRLPIRLPSDVHLGPRFHLRPLFPLLAAGARLGLLSLGREYTRLFDCTSESCRPLDWYDLPVGLDESLRYDGRRRSLQFHDGTEWCRSAASGAGPLASVVSRRWTRLVSLALQPFAFGPAVPLAVGGLASLVESFPAGRVPGEVHRLDPERLGQSPTCGAVQEAGRALVRRVRRLLLRDRLQRMASPPDGLQRTQDLGRIQAACRERRVDSLIFTEDEPWWGRFPGPVPSLPRTGERSRYQEVGWVEQLAIEILAGGGNVEVTDDSERPERPPIAALVYSTSSPRPSAGRPLEPEAVIPSGSLADA